MSANGLDKAKATIASQQQMRLGMRVLLLFALVFALSAILIFQLLPSRVQLREGDVSPQDILAPRKVTYVSQIRTEEEKKKAEAEVQDIYDPPDAKIARQQLTRVNHVLDYIDSIRHDTYATPERKSELINAIPELDLSPSLVDEVLGLDDQSWQQVATEVPYVLNQVMREEIREDQLDDAKRLIPRYISPDLSDEQVGIVSQLAKSFLLPNSLYNAQRTEESKRKASEAVEPVRRAIEKGEAILREGDIVTPLHLEALDALGLRQAEIEWQGIIGTVVFVIMIVLIFTLYLSHLQPNLWANERHTFLLTLLIVLFVFAAKLVIPGHVVLPYLLPLAAVSMLLTVLFGAQLAITITILLSLIVGFIGGGSLELTVYALAGGLIASLSLWRVERLSAFLWAGGYVALANLGVVLAFRLPSHDYDVIGLLTLTGVSALNGMLAASLTLAGFFLFGNLFGITTSLQLMELARPNHPLLRQLQLKAPGTYHHSIIISNMAEQAAEQIEADSLLVRVGAYYHDIGKTLRPYFFSENQMDGINVHDRLDPKTSAQIIIAHVKDGLDLARKYSLPRPIQDLIAQHHGTHLVTYFYRKARQESGDQELSEEGFHYPGPKPQTREAAIMMLADSTEATIRANRPSTAEEIEQTVRKIIDNRLRAGELSECDLTFRDLDKIGDSFINILQGIFHPRVKYPEEVRGGERTRPEEDAT